jgi:ornithine carbamoyltransferase
LEGKTAALIFQKPSLRTRVSFEVGITQLGGHPTFLSHEAIGLGIREKTSDVAQLLSRYVKLIVARVFDHDFLTELAAHATVPVINALSDYSHPCQVMADIYTVRQHNRLKEGVKVAYVGDGNNVVRSWLELASIYPLRLTLGCPAGYEPAETNLAAARSTGVSDIRVTTDPVEAVEGAEVLYTDTWTSMGQESESAKRKQLFMPYQLNEKLLKHAAPDAIVMHCLPAHRGEEITDAVLDGPRSVVFDEAENRLHIQKAIMVKLTGNAAVARSMSLRQHTVDA